MSASVLRFQRLLGVLEQWFEETCSLFERELFQEGLASQARCQAAIDELAALLQQSEVRASIDGPTQYRMNRLLENFRQESIAITARKSSVSADALQRRKQPNRARQRFVILTVRREI